MEGILPRKLWDPLFDPPPIPDLLNSDKQFTKYKSTNTAVYLIMVKTTPMNA